MYSIEITPEIKEQREIFNLDIPTNQEVFYTIFFKEEPIGYILTEIITNCVVPHIYIKPEYRHKEYIEVLPKIFQECYIPELIKYNIKLITTSCDIKDNSTKDLLKLLGFELSEITMGIIKLENKVDQDFIDNTVEREV